jgi:plastocyanin
MTSKLKQTLDRCLALLGVLLILATAAVLVISAGGKDAAAKPAVAAAEVDDVRLADFKFAPEAITVPVNSTITWTNDDNASHTATSGASPTPDGLFDTDIIAKGHSRKIKLTKRGTFEYYCALHPFMHGTVTVR